MSHQSENELIVKAVHWTMDMLDALREAGGSSGVLHQFSNDLLSTMVRNNLVLKYEKP